MMTPNGSVDALLVLLDADRANLRAQVERVPAAPLTATPGEIAAAQMTPERIAAVRVRSAKLAAPERVLPTGTLTPEQAMDQLAASRTALRAAFLAAPPAVLDGSLAPHPFIGPLTLRAWVELIAHHDARHADQVADVADRWAGAR